MHSKTMQDIAYTSVFKNVRCEDCDDLGCGKRCNFEVLHTPLKPDFYKTTMSLIAHNMWQEINSKGWNRTFEANLLSKKQKEYLSKFSFDLSKDVFSFKISFDVWFNQSLIHPEDQKEVIRINNILCRDLRYSIPPKIRLPWNLGNWWSNEKE